jgi:threonine dehydrogenase-like Zn-dependent dehydrogenase
MLAVAVREPGKLEIVDIPKPAPGPYEAVIRSRIAFICNATDRKLLGGVFPGMGADKYPLLLGHENVGVVESVGAKVRSFRPGERVVGGLLLRPTDPRYQAGWGGNSEYVVAVDHAAMAEDGVADEAHGWNESFKIMLAAPADIPIEAVGLLCTWREVYAGFSDFHLQAGQDLLVFGGGPVGLSFCRFARLLGLGWIALADPVAAKRDKALALGADAVFAPDSPDILRLVAKRGRALEAVIDAVGSEKVVNAGLPLIRMGGSICVYGVHSPPRITLEKDTGPYNFNLYWHQWPTRDAEAAAQEPLVRWIRDGKLSYRDFLTGEFPIREVAKAMAASQEPEAIKTLLRFSEGARA